MWFWLRTDQTQYWRAGCAVAHDLHGRTRYGPYQHRPVGRIPEYGYLLRLRALPTGWNDELHGGRPHVRGDDQQHLRIHADQHVMAATSLGLLVHHDTTCHSR